MKSLIFLVAFTALLIIAACCYPEITQGLAGSKGAKSSSPCTLQLLDSCAGDVQFRRETSNLPFFSRTCRGFEIPQLCVDRSLPAVARGVLISAREEDGALPAPDTAGSVGSGTRRTRHAEVTEVSYMSVLEAVRWQTRMKQ